MNDKEAAKVALSNLNSAIWKLKTALWNKKVSALLITEAEVASILLALNEFGFDDDKSATESEEK